MTNQTQDKKEDEISLIDILLFLKASGLNVLLSSVVCLMVGIAYYLTVPKMYEASAAIQMATVGGELVESPAVLFEKIKLPLFFSSSTLQACGSDGGPNSYLKFADKLKATVNKSAPIILLSLQTLSAQESRACLEAVVSEIQKSQNQLIRPLIEQKIYKVNQLSDQLKLVETISKSISVTSLNSNTSELKSYASIAVISEMNKLRNEIYELENYLSSTKTKSLSLAAPIYESEVSNKRRTLSMLMLCLVLGVFIGLFVTWLIPAMTKIRMDITNSF
jgi:hypothetical protein